MNLDPLLLLFSVAVTALLALGLRGMQGDHLFAIGHRIECAGWAIFSLYLVAMMFRAPTDMLMAVYPAEQSSAMERFFLLYMAAARFLAVAAFTLGNPPRVRIQVTPKQKALLSLEEATSTPGVATEPDGSVQVRL